MSEQTRIIHDVRRSWSANAQNTSSLLLLGEVVHFFGVYPTASNGVSNPQAARAPCTPRGG